MRAKIITFLMFALVSLSLNAQEVLTHPKKTFISPEGKLFIQKGLPVYLWMSTSPNENAEKIRLKSTETPQYANPMYLDTEGYNTVRSPSCVDTVTRKAIVPQQDVIYEIYADSESPRTKISYGANTYKKDGKIYVGAAAKIELTARDALSGVEQILYSLDGAPYKKYSSVIAISQEKDYVLKYYAVDNVGNVEDVTELNIVYDKSAPATTLNIEGEKHKDVLSGKTILSLNASDKGIGVREVLYKLDDGSEKVYKSALNTAYLSQGEHTISYRSVDEVNNEETLQTYNFYVDKTAPTIIEEVEGKSFFANGKEYSSGRARLKLTALDNKAGVKEIKYSINGSEFKTYDKPVNLSIASGKLVVKSYAIDNVGNSSQSQAANSAASIPYIDLTGPKLTHGFNGSVFTSRDTVFIGNKTSIVLKANDTESGILRIDYQIDGGTLETFDKPFTIPTEGVHQVKFTGYDNVDNSSSSAFIVKVDTTGPAIDYQFSTSPVKGNDVYPSHVIMFLSATDNVVGLEKITYNISGTGTNTYIHPINNLNNGPKSIKVKAFDKLNNSSETEIQFEIQ